jgi:hypothetical protein
VRHARNNGRIRTERAEASGVDPSRLSRFVRGQHIIFTAAVRLCEALGIRLVLPRRLRKKK